MPGERHRVGRRALLLTALAATAAGASGPVIDMHLHASQIRSTQAIPVCPGDQPFHYPAQDPRAAATAETVVCDRPLLSPRTSAGLRDGTVAEMRKYNVRRGVLAGDPALVREWMDRAPGRFIAAAAPARFHGDGLAALRRLHAQGRAAVFAEIGAQYLGMRADDPALEPFWALAEELDVPVGIHLGEGMPGQFDGANDRYRVALTSPFQLEAVLIRHPRLRLYVMHAASPLTEEMIAMLFEYRQLYVDISANDWNMPRAQFYDQLKRMVDAGFAQRILFGSDQTIWPQGIGLAIDTIEQAPFLTAAQKRDILYNNAARFLRLTQSQIAADHQ